jgi:hypothetical protein
VRRRRRIAPMEPIKPVMSRTKDCGSGTADGVTLVIVSWDWNIPGICNDFAGHGLNDSKTFQSRRPL